MIITKIFRGFDTDVSGRFTTFTIILAAYHTNFGNSLKKLKITLWESPEEILYYLRSFEKLRGGLRNSHDHLQAIDNPATRIFTHRSRARNVRLAEIIFPLSHPLSLPSG